MNFGDNLKSLRKSKKISQEVLAEKVGVSRQSVSKWETGESYPEMNNILMLCKIFHCNINDLVNNTLTDIDSLDEEIKMNVVKFKEEKQRKMKGLSKLIYLGARMAKILTLLGAILIALTMIICPILLNRVDLEKDTITLLDREYSYRLDDNRIIINDYVIDTKGNIENYIESHSMMQHIFATEYVLLCLLISIIFIFQFLKYIEKLFINIYKEDTPFTLENVSYIKKIAFFLLLAILFPNVTGILFQLVMRIDMGVELELTNLLISFIIISLAYIFEYGYELQLDSGGKIYG